MKNNCTSYRVNSMWFISLPDGQGDSFKILRLCGLMLMVPFLGTALGQETGIAARYLGDSGIEKDPAVIFSENFEESSLSSVISRWTSSSNDSGMSLPADVPLASSGKHSLLVTSINGVNTGGRIYKRFNPGYDLLYLRYYVKYAPPPGYYDHTGGRLAGCSEPTGTCGGHSGERPLGNDMFTTGAEPNYEYAQPSTGVRMDFYTYWMGMRLGTSGVYYGNTFVHDPNVKVDYGQWTCVEIMVKVNDPITSSNGEQALWLNGKEIVHLGPGFPKGKWIGGNDFQPDSSGTPFDGFQWRSVGSLKINLFKIEHYVESGNEPQGYLGKCWFDDIVCATSYIGPISTINRAVPNHLPPKHPSPVKRILWNTIESGGVPELIVSINSSTGHTDYYTLTGDKMNYLGRARDKK